MSRRNKLLLLGLQVGWNLSRGKADRFLAIGSSAGSSNDVVDSGYCHRVLVGLTSVAFSLILLFDVDRVHAHHACVASTLSLIEHVLLQVGGVTRLVGEVHTGWSDSQILEL